MHWAAALPKTGSMSLQTTAERLEADLDLTAYVDAVDIDTGANVDLRADDAVVSASVFKVPVLLEVCCQIAEGDRSATERINLAPQDFATLGPTGLSVTSDAVSLSLRDLYLSMMTVSDNRATDVVMALVGRERINARMAALGLHATVLERDCSGLFSQMREELGPDRAGSLSLDDAALAELLASDAVRGTRALDPERTNRTTPQESTDLLARIWTDDGIDPGAAAECRRVLGLQVWPHRLRSGFGDEAQTSGKTGTLPTVRNEVGVVEYPDGGRYAVAVFLRTQSLAMVNPDADRAIGTLAAAAVADLRAG